jgi:hypothetical protein
MNFALGYLGYRLLFRLGGFFLHWYVDASRWFLRAFVSTIGRFERTLAIRVTLRHLFEPLYKDYSVVGRMLGPLFRTGRVIVGVVWYFVLAGCFALLYLAWLTVIPLLLLYAAGIL